MSYIVWADVLSQAPSLSTVSDQAQTDILLWANSILDVSMLDGAEGIVTRLARIYLAAHAGLSLPTSAGGSSGVSGTVTSESVGSISRSYGTGTASGSISTDWLSLTVFGRAYLNIISSSFGRLPLVMG